MLDTSTGFNIVIPDITIDINCDTILAINLDMLGLGNNDEFIFTIKNYDYIDSPYVFIYRACKKDLDDNGEIIFKIPSFTSKHLKPNAFYSMAVLVDAFDVDQPTTYKKVVDNGKIIVNYGMQDLIVDNFEHEITGAYLDIIEE